jgi:quercetin dioxygenase-like cupin family protein
MSRSHRSQRGIVALATAIIVATAAASMAVATPGSGVVGLVLARGTLEAGDRINTTLLKLTIREDVDVVTQSITIAPGGHTGWHSHPGPVFVTIVAGTMTFYDADDPSCTAGTYETGDAFIDAGGGHVHIARNEGLTDLVLSATYLVPVGVMFRTDVPNPGHCSF